MSVKIGVSLIAWQNDDLPELTAAYTTEGAMEDAARIGYAGVERGRRMPADTDGLRAYLDRYGVALCGGWFSGSLMAQDAAAEKAALGGMVAQFAALDAPCIVYAECANTIQGDAAAPLSRRPKLAREDVTAYAGRLTELAKWARGQGMPLAYHHHMGSMIQDEEDIDWLMDGSGPELDLLFDTGHLHFAGGNVTGVLDKWAHRIGHVHFKDVRQPVLDRIRANDGSFLDAVQAGAFTVPGDPEGCIDFQAVTDRLAAMQYEGWIVVEAEQDPAKAPPAEYARLGFDHIVGICRRSGLEIAPASAKG
ncbi:MocC-like protein (rhizopine catabolism), myo-inositol catabolism iolE-like protein [Oceanicola granulosus HTCC2516]|uniref:MocC-like protein (Rhizopine catabolism), myo-inositol catabolism iolE-like protein n=1 Tax=Oceanicola granulosus (strain ATCC BAA-861 / DSM 15982 / KCTC 12143 / HTCC2516) TaxID=314256 RepID=Q2CEM6_OCEGH|nr:myo-inosose-2 dehydratase [Oceanicola granulosus]EAR51106.1 MocC-like protein (rhizopine catabolism), myo-inositol catabolism iolE-like protein [Oceanicola granulosus HTCC2516]